jgi:release factor glutamine methyltransferase
MPASPAFPSSSVIVARLRAAGCVFAEDEARLLRSAASTPADLTAMVDRRAAGLPLEHVVGWAEFCGLRIAVDPRVFVPRRRTEFLVCQALNHLREASARQAGPDSSPAGPDSSPAGPDSSPASQDASPPGEGAARHKVVIVDLCCGSGAVGAALAAALGPVELHAADLDPVAVRCARRNVAAAGGQVYVGDLYEPLPATLRGRVDLLAVNAPYVPTEEVGLLPPEAREHEPHLALDGGTDGLDILRRVTAVALPWLAPGGCLLFESSQRQAPEMTRAVARAGLIPRLASSEELNATVVLGLRPAAGQQAGGLG